MGGLLNSSYLFFFIGVLLGLYLGSKSIRAKVNEAIDKYILKKGNTPKPTATSHVQTKRTIIIDGKKYSEDTSQDDGRNT